MTSPAICGTIIVVSKVIGVYGSLREGGSNHPLLRTDGVAGPQTVLRIPGRLYSLGEYSCAVPLNDGEDGDIVVEIYEVQDRIFDSLDEMEREAGYVPLDTTATDDRGVARTFLVWYLPEAPAGAQRVESGDWVAACRSRNQLY